jgi:hypothetical protein
VKQTSQSQRCDLLWILLNEIAYFDAGGYGKPFRSQWRPTLLLRDSPLCINYRDNLRQNPCSQCPMFSLVPPEKHGALLPCHHIVLKEHGESIAQMYAHGAQDQLDKAYRDWLENTIQELKTL